MSHLFDHRQKSSFKTFHVFLQWETNPKMIFNIRSIENGFGLTKTRFFPG